MAKPSLDGVRLKLVEADNHLDFLRTYQRAHVDAGDRRIIGDYDPDTRDYVFRVSGDLPPLDAGLHVSLFAHLLRSSLDNMLWQLIRLRGGHPRTTFGPKGSGLRPTQFPIYEQEADFRTKAKAETRGIEPPDFTFIKDSQPYQAGAKLARWHPLALLGHLNNVDKHRFVHPTFAAGVIQEVIQPIPGAKGIPVGRPYLTSANGALRLLRASESNAPLVDGTAFPDSKDGSVIANDGWGFIVNEDDPAEVARVFRITIASGREPKMEMEPSPAFDISFCDRERPMSIIDFIEVRDEVRRIVDRFAPDFRE
jgi:hypothetical protein